MNAKLPGIYQLSGRVGQWRNFSSNNNTPQFEEAQKRLQTLKKSPGNDVKLKIYALFKQATVGPVNTKRPGRQN